MLVLQRRENEVIRIGDDITITIVDIDRYGKKVRLGIDAPGEISVHREEVYRRIEAAKGNGNIKC
ncbi:MAG: carbon storage regulator CsrA [Rhodospirillaceae bacterium]|nr:carbon storage regulator CsrA [Rhodospirillaceae bacterium]